MLGASLVEDLSKDFNVYATAKNNFDKNVLKKFMKFDLREDSYEKLLNWSKPDIVIHCAAITNVDYCELNREEAFLINSESIRKFLNYKNKYKIIFISSEAVFADNINLAEESELIMPQNIYGLSKKKGERYLEDYSEDYLVIRTTIIGKNLNNSKTSFMEWIINSLKSNIKIKLFDDVIFNPISIWSLCTEIRWTIKNDLRGIFHISGKDQISKYDFGLKLCKVFGFDENLIIKSSIDEFSFKAKRSRDQTLNCSKYEMFTKRNLPGIEYLITEISQNFQK